MMCDGILWDWLWLQFVMTEHSKWTGTQYKMWPVEQLAVLSVQVCPADRMDWQLKYSGMLYLVRFFKTLIMLPAAPLFVEKLLLHLYFCNRKCWSVMKCDWIPEEFEEADNLVLVSQQLIKAEQWSITCDILWSLNFSKHCIVWMLDFVRFFEKFIGTEMAVLPAVPVCVEKLWLHPSFCSVEVL